ncbi:hypothetical protein IFR05_011282 [Cadophora sp. M221]|nr:hypothetical protein IFR05_011282 [Cadophora sp. M221]
MADNATKSSSHLPTGHWYEVWNLPSTTISFFATQDVKLHRQLRSRVSGAYSMSSILAMEPLIQEVADLNWKRFRGFANQGAVIYLRYWADYFAFDFVGSLARSRRETRLPGEQGKDIDLIIKSIHKGFFIMAKMGYFPGQMLIFNNKVSKYLVAKFGGRSLNVFDDFLRWLEAVVEKRMKDGSGYGRRDMLQHFIDAKDDSGQPVKMIDVMSEGVNILVLEPTPRHVRS